MESLGIWKPGNDLFTKPEKRPMMTMMMMQRIIESTHKSSTQDLSTAPCQDQKPQDYEKRDEPQLFLQQKRISDDSRDAEMCEKGSDSEDEKDVDVENDETLCPVDLTRRHEKFHSFEILQKTDDGFKGVYQPIVKDEENKVSISVKRAESVCSDVSRSESPRDESPSVVPHQNRRLAFSVENILDPNKFTGRQSVYSDGICCWKPHQESVGSSDFDGSETGR